MNTFFGSTFIDKEKLEEAGINYPIKVEYYKKINEDDVNSDNKAKFGITIVETKYLSDDIKVKTKDIKYVTNDEVEENRILNIFKESQVTLINSEEVIRDLFNNRLLN